jgi:serine/threonine protein kinase
VTEGPGGQRPAVAGLEILRPLGRGSAAVVWLARHVALDRLCAVKQIPLSDGADPRQLMREAQLLAALAHPHVVAVYDVLATAADVVVVMEYLAAGTLSDWIAAGGPAWEETLTITEQVGAAIAAAGAIGVVHRDLKPANILLDERGGCHVGDFGVATLRSRRATPGADDIVGTPAYMSPEQARGDGAVPASDVYSLGVITYELLCGRRPFEGGDAASVMRHHAMKPPPQPRALCPDIPAGVERELLRCLDKRPARRRSAPEFASRLRASMSRVPASLRLSMPAGSCAPPARAVPSSAGSEEPTLTRVPAYAGGSAGATPTVTDPARAQTVGPASTGPGRAPLLSGGERSRHYPWRWIVPIVAAIVVASFAVRLLRDGSSQGSLQVTSATLSAPTTSARCPGGDLAITADVAVNGSPGTITYTWHEPDGTTTSQATTDVGAGSAHVTLNLRLHLAGEEPIRGAVTLEVSSPSAIVSPPLPVELTCP